MSNHIRKLDLNEDRLSIMNVTKPVIKKKKNQISIPKIQI